MKRSSALACAALLSFLPEMHGQIQQVSATPVYVVTGMPAAPAPLVGARKIRVLYANKFRFDFGVQTTSTSIAAATVPGLLAPSSGSSTLPAALPKAAGPAAADQGGTPANPRGRSPQSAPAPVNTDTLTQAWNNIREHVQQSQKTLLGIRNNINTLIRAEAAEQNCYQLNLGIYSSPILTEVQATSLLALAVANQTVFDASSNSNSCRSGGIEGWPFDTAQALVIQLTDEQNELNDMQSDPNFATWDTGSIKTANDALTKQLADMLSEALAYTTGAVTTGSGAPVTQTYSDLGTLDQSNRKWRTRLALLLGTHTPPDLSALAFDVAIAACREWYGKGRSDTITLRVTDASSATLATTDISLATNTCLPMTIASTGIGVTFLANPTYAFVPGSNTGTSQVIGETASNNHSPLYALLYNVKLPTPPSWFNHGFELFASPGVGLASTSSTTTGDFLGGVSLSFARRTLFLTPAVDFGQRNQLAPGFALGTAQGSLTSVPTVSRWQPGFMLTITFGIGPS